MFFSDEKNIPNLVSSIKRGLNNIQFGAAIDIKTEGVGLKFKRYSSKSNLVSLKLGYAHRIFYQFSKDIKIRCSKYKLLMYSTRPEYLYDVASKVRGYRPPDAYKGRGLKYSNERLKFKPGKQRLR